MTPDRPSCALCGWAPLNTALLLWDVPTDTRYCADHAACTTRQTGRPVPDPRDHARCPEHHTPAHSGGPIRCARDHAHDTPHRDLDGREWETAA